LEFGIGAAVRRN